MKKFLMMVMVICLVIPFTHIVMADQPDEGDSQSDTFQLGVEKLLNDDIHLISDKNVGLITNPTGVDQELNSIVDRFHEHEDINLVALYGPEHGVRGDAQAGDYVESYTDERTGLPVYSLYGDTRKPSPEMLEDVDVLVFDIQDVGTRFYTYIYTMAYVMEAAAENDIEMVVLDRPNPIGGVDVSGPVLDPDYASFVGLYPIPLRHGMTVGELALFFNKEFDIDADLQVVTMDGWNRAEDYEQTPLEWVLPSPNMPTLDTAYVYSGAALIEGTNVSEGRGTTKPFELIGAPFIDGDTLSASLNDANLEGVIFRAAYFTPQSSKHSGNLSGGVEIHVTNTETYDPVKAGLTIVKTLQDLYPNEFEMTSFFDQLIGNGWVREMILNDASIDDIEAEWADELAEFKNTRENYLLYADSDEPTSLRMMSYNIQTGIGTDTNYDLDRTVEAIRESGADVIGLQEVDKYWGDRSNFDDVLKILADALDMHSFYAPIYDFDSEDPEVPNRQYGLAILSKYPITQAINHEISRLSTQSANPVPELAPGFPEALINVKGQELRLYNTHLDYRGDPAVRILQVDEMLDIMSTKNSFLVGDLNALPDAPELQPLFEVFNDAWEVVDDNIGFTFPADDPIKRIDFILTSPDIEVKYAEVLNTQASDHLPVIADITLSD